MKSRQAQCSLTKKKEELDLYDYFEWRIRPKQKKKYRKPTMDDFDQEIKFKWRFVLSIPTFWFLAFIVYYYQHYNTGLSFTNFCDYAE